MNNADPFPRSVDLYIMLDIFGAYWFAPCWSEDLCHYDVTSLEGRREMDILAFEWPEVSGRADGLAFWAALFEDGTFNLFGAVDYVTFGYEPSSPSSTPTPTFPPGPSPTPAPSIPPTATATPTVKPPGMSVSFNNDDPGSYSLEHCETPEHYCFEPQIVPHCSDYHLVAVISNTGDSVLHVTVSLSGDQADEFEPSFSTLDIPSRESVELRVRFCPQMPRNRIKHATLVIAGAGDTVSLALAGYGA